MGHLNEHRFNHNFQNCISPLCSCSFETESTSHFLMHCHHYTNIHSTLTNSIGNTFNATNEYLDNLSLFGSPKYTEIDNSQIINATINYLAHFFNLPNIFDFGYISRLLILDFLFIFNPNAYHKHYSKSCGIVVLLHFKYIYTLVCRSHWVASIWHSTVVLIFNQGRCRYFWSNLLDRMLR